MIWKLPNDFLTEAAFRRALSRVDMQSSPGVPYMKEATTNGDWLKWNGLECDEFQVMRLWYDVSLVLNDQWEHLIRVFIKQEPHKKMKAKEGRWRLIMASSLPVQMVWHMLFGFQNDLEIEQCYNIPSQQGLVMVGGAWKQYLASWKSQGLTVGLDKSAWDWTAPKWCIDLDLELRYRLGRGDCMEEWLKMAKLMYHHMFDYPILILSDGTMLRQQMPGIMKSGCVNTISTNSHCQQFIHCVVAEECSISYKPFPKACGDDTLQHPKHTMDVSLYWKYGIMVKSVSEDIEFVGHEFTDRGPHPLYISKHFKKLQYMPDEHLAQYFDSMARMYVHTRYFELWQRLAEENNTPLPLSKSSYLYWYDNSD